MAAVIEVNQDIPEFRYSPHNLNVILATLIPRPLVLIVGRAISEEMTNEAVDVFQTYVKETEDVKEEDTLVIPVRLFSVSYFGAQTASYLK